MDGEREAQRVALSIDPKRSAGRFLDN